MFDASSALGRSAPLAQDRPSQPTLGDREPGKSVKPKLLLVNKSKAGTSKGRVGAQHEPPSWPASVAENDSRSGGRKAATRLPGRFDNDDTSSPLNADSPANIFVLKGMQPPSKHAEPPMPSATPPARQPVPPASGVGDLGRTDRLLLQRRSSDLFRAGQRHKTQHPERDSDEGSVHKLDVYGIDGEQAGIGAISAADGFLRSGSKVFIRDGESSHRKSLDFQGLKMMQVIDPSLLGRVLLQQVQPFQLTGRKGITQETVLVQDERPSLSLVNRHSVLSADAHLDNKANDVDEAIDSLMYLPSCNDAAILDCLQHRFHRGLYFTSCDNMLIFVNPWESHESAVGEVFNRRKAVQYWTAHIAELPSHPYLVARRAFTNAMKQHRNQLVLTFGTFGAGQDRVHHELVKLFIRFALTMEDTWTDEEARAAEIERDAAVSLLESLHITHRGELFGGRLVDLFQVELDAEGGVVGFSFLPNSSYEPSQDIVSWQMRQSLKSVPLPNLFYHVMYGIHYNVGDPVLEVAGLHPADVTALMHYFPLPFNTYEDAQYEKCQQFLSDLSTIGLSDRQKEEFLQILSAILVADVASYKIHNELPEEGQQAAEQESDVPASSAPRVRRIMKQKERTVEHAFVVGSKSAMTLAGLDIINLLANLLGIDETVLRDIFNGPDFWQVRFLALKLFVRLRWWLLGIIGQSLRLSKSTEVHKMQSQSPEQYPEQTTKYFLSLRWFQQAAEFLKRLLQRSRITLLKAAGLDFRHTGPDWAFNQLLHNYTEECFLHLFASWAFTLDQATYLLEDVEPPPANFHMNDEILDVFTGPDGIWHILKHEHTTRGGEAADDLSDGVPLAAVSFVDKILKSKSCTNKIRQVPGYKPPKPETLKPKMAVRVVKATAKAATVRASSLRRKASDFDDSLCRFTVVHTSGTLVYDASKFCTSDANAYTVAPRLRTLLLQSKLELLRTLVQHETAHDVIPTDCLRISVTNRLIHYVKDSLSEGEEAPQTNFIACVSSLRPLSGMEGSGEEPSFKLNPYVKRWRQNILSHQGAHARGDRSVGTELIGALCHEPQLPSRVTALVASEAKFRRGRTGFMQGFDSSHVWKQLNNLQILTYCTTRYLGMTVRLLYEQFLELYSILCIPSSYGQQTTKMLLQHPNPRAASAFLLQVLRFPNTGYQLGRTMVFFRKAAFLVLEKTRIEYLERLVPAVIRVQRMWRTVRERAFVADMHWLCVRVQSHFRRILLLRELKKLKPLKDLFFGAVVVSGIAYAFRRVGLSDEAIQSIETKYRNREVYCLRWSAAVCVQSWWRSIMAQKLAAKLRHALLLDHSSLLVQNAWRSFKAQAIILEKISEEIIPNRAATLIQRHVRGWRERRKFQELRGLTMAFLSIQRKGAKLYSMRVMLNYRPIIRHTTVMRDMIAAQMNTSVVRIQSFFRMVIIRQQYMRLRNAAVLCQAGALTRLRRGDYLLAKRMVVKIQRWWRSVLLLRGLEVEVALPMPIRLPKKADSVVARRELVAFELLRPHLLRVQGVFRVERMRQEYQYAYPIGLHTNCDCRAIYPRTWAQPLQDLLVRTAGTTSFQQDSYIAEATQMAPVMFLDLAIGGHHSVVLLAVRQPASGNFATRVRAAIKGGSWQDFNLVPSVYAWGWGDRGQLGEKQSPREQGMTCVGPLKFVDRVFRDTMDLQTGHLIQQLVQEVDYTHTVCSVAAGLDHSLALTNEGMAFAWGDNTDGQCGLGHRLMWVRQPTLIPTIRNNAIRLKSIVAGPRQSGAVCSDGKALMWGAAHFVRLPTLTPDSHSYTPREVPIDSSQEALQICCSSGFNVLRTAGAAGVFAWGSNDSGQLGQGIEDKKSRDMPTFVALPATPTNPHVVSKVAVGKRFVVVCLQQKSPFLYTWGALPVEASNATSKSPGGAEGKKPSAEAEQRAMMNPFLKFSGFKAPQPQQAKPAAPPPKTEKLKAICRPTRVAHPLWKGDAVVDIGVTGVEVLVLFESRVVHGYSWLEVVYTKRESAPVTVVEERVTVQSFFFKKQIAQPKEPELPKEAAISCELERLKGEFTLEPGVYSLRHLKPLRMVIRSLHTTGNAVSLACSWATAVRPTRQLLENIISSGEAALSKKYRTATGAPIELPKKVIERDQNKYREILESTNRLLTSSLLSRENQSRQSAKPLAETLVPDSRLLQRMRAIYSIRNARSNSASYDSEHEDSVS